MKIKDFAKEVLGVHAWVLTDVVGNYDVNKVVMDGDDSYTIHVTENNGVKYTLHTTVCKHGHRSTKITNEFMHLDHVEVFTKTRARSGYVCYYTRKGSTPIGRALRELIAVVARNQ